MQTTQLEALEKIARSLVANGKGILAADESTGTIEKRLKSVGVGSTEETRRAYRELLLTAPGLGAFISGVILYDETLRQKAANGIPFAETLRQQGIVPGIKVDRGAKPLAGFPEEKITEGLDGLRERIADYRQLGARFTKWRAVFSVSEKIPTRAGILANAHALARYAALAQEADLVPIVEPEVLMDGAHSIERHGEVTEEVLYHVFSALQEYGVALEGILLKPNMVLPGTTQPHQASPDDVARATLAVLKRTVPAAVSGIVFLSGGQGDEQATANLNAMNRLGGAPWALSFSFGRALQAAALKAWSGHGEKIADAQKALLHRARCNSAARSGRYTVEMEET